MMSDIWTRYWTSTVVPNATFKSDISYDHTGPVEFKLDVSGNLRLVATEEDGAEITIALHLAGTFSSVSQEMAEEEDDEEDYENTFPVMPLDEIFPPNDEKEPSYTNE